jgi:major membrane immunogen (membrane-anchored lipoprotein)
MKKMIPAIASALALLLALFTLTACGSSTPAADTSGNSYKDGTYTGVSGADEKGAYGEITLVIRGGEISDCTYVTYQKDGTIKAEDYGKVNGEIENPDYYEKAQLAVRAMQQYADELAQKKNPKDVEAVSGATNSYNQFQEAAFQALDEAQAD